MTNEQLADELERKADLLDMLDALTARRAAAALREQDARIAELEAAIGEFLRLRKLTPLAHEGLEEVLKEKA